MPLEGMAASYEASASASRTLATGWEGADSDLATRCDR